MEGILIYKRLAGCFRRGEKGRIPDRGNGEAGSPPSHATARQSSLGRRLGEWRGHREAMFPLPGMKDLQGLADARDEMGVVDHPPLILIIGENDIRFHMMI